MTFKEAFAAARKAGKGTFTWNGKKYTTKLREDAAPKKSATPKAKPSRKSKSASVRKSTAPKSSPRPMPVRAGSKGDRRKK